MEVELFILLDQEEINHNQTEHENQGLANRRKEVTLHVQFGQSGLGPFFEFKHLTISLNKIMRLQYCLTVPILRQFSDRKPMTAAQTLVQGRTPLLEPTQETVDLFRDVSIDRTKHDGTYVST